MAEQALRDWREPLAGARVAQPWLEPPDEAEMLSMLAELEPFAGDDERWASTAKGALEGVVQSVTALPSAITRATAAGLGIQHEPRAEQFIQSGIDRLLPEQVTLAAQASPWRMGGQVGGQLAGLVGGGWLGGLARVGVRTGAPAALGRVAGQANTTAAMTAGMGAQEFAQRADASEEMLSGPQFLLGMAAGGAIGSLDSILAGRLLGRINTASGGAVGRASGMVGELRALVADAPTAWRSAKAVARGGGIGAITEGTQAVLMNALVQHATDEELDLLQGATQESTAGGIADTVLSAAVEALTYKGRARTARLAGKALDGHEWALRYRTDPVFRAQEDAEDILWARANEPDPEHLPAMEEAARLAVDEHTANALARHVAENPVLLDVDPESLGGLLRQELGARVPSEWGAQEFGAVQGHARALTERGMEATAEHPMVQDTMAELDRALSARMALARAIPSMQRMTREAVEHEAVGRASAWVAQQIKAGTWEASTADAEITPFLERDFGLSPEAAAAAVARGKGGAGALDLTPTSPPAVEMSPAPPSEGATPQRSRQPPTEAELRYVMRMMQAIEAESAPAAEAPAAPEATTTDYRAEPGATGPAQSVTQVPAPGTAPVEAGRLSRMSRPSSEARMPLGVHQPSGATMYPISGGGHDMGGTDENVIGAKSTTRLEHIGHALRELATKLGGVIRIARTPDGSGVAGFYRGGEATMRAFNEVTTLAHEVGHLLHREVMSGQFTAQQIQANPAGVLSQLSPALQGEITHLAYPGANPQRLMSEGFAEMVRLYVTNPEELSARAPNVERWFEGWLLGQPRAIRKSIEVARQLAHDYRFQGLELRQQTVPTEGRFERTRDAIRALPHTVMERIVDDSNAFNPLDKRLRKTGVQRSMSERDYFESTRSLVEGRTHEFLYGTPMDMEGNVIPGAKNLQEVLRPIKPSELALFNEYLLSRMTRALEHSPKPNTPKAPAEGERLIERLNRTKPHFADVADEFQRWWEHVNFVLAKASPNFSAEMQRIRDYNATHGIDFYVQLKRRMPKDEARGKNTGAGSGQKTSSRVSQARSETGSVLPVIRPTESMVELLRNRMHQAALRHNAEHIIELYQSYPDQLRGYVSDVTDPNEITSAPRATYDPQGADWWDDVLGFFKEPENTGKSFVYRHKDRSGQTRSYAIDWEIAKLFAAIDPQSMAGGVRAWTTLERHAKAGLVGMEIVHNPAFQFFKNLAMDIPTFYLASQYYSPGTLPLYVLRTARNLATGLTDLVTPGTWERQFDRLGLRYSSGLRGEMQTARTSRGLVTNRSPTSGAAVGRAITSWWEAIGALMGLPGRAVQITNMQVAAKKHGIDITKGNLDEQDAAVLRKAARMIDYGAGGDLSRQWATVTPFLRPFIDTPKQLARAQKRGPLAFWLKLGELSAAYAALYWMFSDDETEKKRTAEEKLHSLALKIPGTQQIVNVRIDPTLAPIVALPTLLIDGMMHEGRADRASEYAKAMAATVVPPYMPVATNAIMEQVSGIRDPVRSVFSRGGGVPLIPRALQDMSGAEQFTPETAPWAMAVSAAIDSVLGNALDQSNPVRKKLSSPIRWEAFFRATLGQNAENMSEGFGIIPGLRPERLRRSGEEPEPGASLLAGVVRRPDTFNTRNTRDLYALKEAMDTKAADLKGARGDPFDAVMHSHVDHATATIAALRELSMYEQEGIKKSERVKLARLADQIAKSVVDDVGANRVPTTWMQRTSAPGQAMQDMNIRGRSAKLKAERRGNSR